MPDPNANDPRVNDACNDAARRQNAAVWDRMAREGRPLARPATDADLENPLAAIDPRGWLGGSIAGRRVLCLAAGGGRQSALAAAAGAEVTVVDLSPEMLALDRKVAAERGLSIKTVEASMDDLSMLAPAGFDVVMQPVSTCYVPDVGAVYREVARVLAPGGFYISQHKTPTSLQASLTPSDGQYTLDEPYRSSSERGGPLPPAPLESKAAARLREPGAAEFLHTWEQLVGGLCRAGFVVEDLTEPDHAPAANNSSDAAVGTFAHRAQFVAPYVRIKARRVGEAAGSTIAIA